METIRLFRPLAALLPLAACLLLGPPSRVAAAPAPPDTATTTAPVDHRLAVKPAQFRRTSKTTWTTEWVRSPLAFDELIYDWKVRLPRDEAFRLHLQVEFAPGDSSPWLYAGFWGDAALQPGKRQSPRFDRGELDLDQLKLTRRASRFRFAVEDAGRSPLTVRPGLGVIVTDNQPSPETARRFAFARPQLPAGYPILDIPLRKQEDSDGNRLPDRCQSAALAAAMEYFGRSQPLERIICFTTDPEYVSFGIWPRTLAAAMEHGFDAYLDRFRDWDHVRETVAQNKVILCSIKVPEGGGYVAPPYNKLGGNIVALNGVTADGRVVVTDSALAATGEGNHLQWLAVDFEKVWMRNKGGVGMVICPPPGAAMKTLATLPPFPDRKTKQTTGTATAR